MPFHAPSPNTRQGIGRRLFIINFFASVLISAMLFSKAIIGASGNADTKKITNPY